jgi:hypothetical protein
LDEERFEPAAMRGGDRLALETSDLALAKLARPLESLHVLPDEDTRAHTAGAGRSRASAHAIAAIRLATTMAPCRSGAHAVGVCRGVGVERDDGEVDGVCSAGTAIRPRR